MTIEIEIKFIATPEATVKLPGWLSALACQHMAAEKLTNTYYETIGQQLRQWDMGLRIRGVGDCFEMTIKTAGNSVGGLYQRQEYNVPLTAPELAIARFPQEIWPPATDVAALQTELKPLFTTHFIREKWVVTYRESTIEIALDKGEVSAGNATEDLCEIELELKSGQPDDLLCFAHELATIGGLRLGIQSKAARGYRLAQGNPPREVRSLPLLSVKPKATLEEGMVEAFHLALAHWQYHEELWLHGDSSARLETGQALETLRQIFSLFGSLVPRKASSALRQQLIALAERVRQAPSEAEILCYDADNLLAQLALTHWVSTKNWRQFLNDAAKNKLQASFKRFSDIMLGRIAADLKNTVSRVHHVNEYHDKLVRLNQQLLTVKLLTSAYQPSAVYAWLDCWQRVCKAIVSNDRGEINTAICEAVKTPAFWKNGNA